MRAMDIIIFYSGNDDLKIKEYLSIFTELKIQTELYQMNKNWQTNKDFFKKLSRHNHFFIAVTRQSLESTWFHFIIGYCFGRDYSLYLLKCESKIKLFKNISVVDHGSDYNLLKKYYTKKRNDWEILRKIKNAKLEIKKMGLFFNTYYYFSCIKNNSIEAIGYFLQAGISPDIRDEKGVPAFCKAVRLGRNEIALLILQFKCNIHAISYDNGNNALMDAAAAKNIQMVRILLQKGAEVNVQSKSEQTALMLAVGRGGIEIVKLLIEAKADITLRDVLDMTALRYAQIIENKTIKKYFKKYIEEKKIVLNSKK